MELYIRQYCLQSIVTHEGLKLHPRRFLRATQRDVLRARMTWQLKRIFRYRKPSTRVHVVASLRSLASIRTH